MSHTVRYIALFFSTFPADRRRRMPSKWLQENLLASGDRPSRGLARFEQSRTPMIIGTVRLLPPPDRHAAVLEVLESVQGRVRAQPGCSSCDILDERGSEPAVVLLERWETDGALETHLRSETYRWVLAAIELSGAPGDVRFEHVSASEGMELVSRLRTPAGTTGGATRHEQE
jgi:quinol monooxygenase YgiN